MSESSFRMTRFGIVSLFLCANHAECRTAQERRWAGETIDALEPLFMDLFPQFELFSRTSYVDPQYAERRAFFGSILDGPRVSDGARKWLAAEYAKVPEKGAYARLRDSVIELLGAE